jgi:predicted RNA binding protein YcfA (HicA-like mRNA interferase family)
VAASRWASPSLGPKRQLELGFYFEWAGKDSNLRRLCRQIYSGRTHVRIGSPKFICAAHGLCVVRIGPLGCTRIHAVGCQIGSQLCNNLSLAAAGSALPCGRAAEPRITGREVVRALGRLGWVVIVQRGSHAQLKHPERPGRITVPLHAGEIIGPALLRSILSQAGLSVEELRKVL